LPRRSAKRAPQAQLVPPRRGPRQLKVGDIRARDEQHPCDDKQDGQQRAPIHAPQRRDACGNGCEREWLPEELEHPCAFDQGLSAFANLWLHATEDRGRGLERLPRLQP
jgi:hypothetical protein